LLRHEVALNDQFVDGRQHDVSAHPEDLSEHATRGEACVGAEASIHDRRAPLVGQLQVQGAGICSVKQHRQLHVGPAPRSAHKWL
jgi:hypothetical protein